MFKFSESEGLLHHSFAGVADHAAALRRNYAHLAGTPGHTAVITLLDQALNYWLGLDDISAAHAAIDAAGRILWEMEEKYREQNV